MRKPNSTVKSTTLEGYYATEDQEAFCFDRHAGPDEHAKATTGRVPDCRVYPEELLPAGTDGKFGRWTITVEFEPYESEEN